MRLIDADAIHKFVEDKVAEGKDGWADGVPYEWAYALTAVDMQPTVDAVPVVRCKDCDYFNKKAESVGFCVCGEVTGGKSMMRTGDDFCSYGTCGKNLHYVHGKKCPNCAHEGWDMPQCRECKPENAFKWYKEKAGE